MTMVGVLVVVSIDILPDAEAATLSAWVGEIAAAVGTEILVSDDADAFKTATDEHGLLHQVCKTHVVRNTEQLVSGVSATIAHEVDGSLAALEVTPEQAPADLQEILRLVRERPAGRAGAAKLKAIHARYARVRGSARPSPIGCGA